jgi:hypothetical protein
MCYTGVLDIWAKAYIVEQDSVAVLSSHSISVLNSRNTETTLGFKVHIAQRKPVFFIFLFTLRTKIVLYLRFRVELANT